MMSKARNASITVMTKTTTLIGFITGKITRRKLCHSLQPSIAAASRIDESTLFSPARYSTIT